MIWRVPVVVVAALTLLGAAPGKAEAEAICGSGYTLIVPDGRIFSSTIPAGVTFHFLIGTNLNSGGQDRSYSVEVRNTDQLFVNYLGIFYQIPLGACTLANTGTATDTTRYEPRVGCDGCSAETAFRFSFSGTDRVVGVLVNNGNGVAVPYSISVSETTMFSPAWSTNSTYDTFYSFYNTTSMTINGMLTLYNAAGTAVTTAPLTIAAGATGATNTSSLGTVRSTTGTAKFTHNGPPGAILAEAAIANFSISPTPYIQIVKFAPTRESTH
jgi:hypothetical protein